MSVKRGKLLEDVALESYLEARLVFITFSEGGREDLSFLGGSQVLLELAQPPIVDILGFILASLLACGSRITFVISNDGAAGTELLKSRVLYHDYCAIFV